MAAVFERGSDLTVRVNGHILGGVCKLWRTVRREEGEIREFLTDKPVAVTPKERYLIKLELRRTAEYPFDGAVEEVSVSGGGRTEIYSLCTVEQAESCAAARGDTEYTVMIAARERSVTNE